MSSPFTRRPARVLAAMGTLALAGTLLPAVPADAATADLVINEVYARGGSANQPYTCLLYTSPSPRDS